MNGLFFNLFQLSAKMLLAFFDDLGTRSFKNIKLVDDKNFIRSFGQENIEAYIKLNKNPRKTKIISEGKLSLKNDPKKQHLKYDNSNTPEIPMSEYGTSPTFKGLRSYLVDGKLGNGLVVKGAEKHVRNMTAIIEKHQGSIKTFVTGDRPSDFKNCWRAMVTDEKLINKYERFRDKLKLTWHHLDNLDGDLQSTFQLVDFKTHSDTLTHMGSHAQLKEVLRQIIK